MERDNEFEMISPESNDEWQEGDNGFKAFVAEQLQTVGDRVEPIHTDFDRAWQDLRKDVLLSARARDIAKAVALDGNLTKSEKQDLHKAFQEAHELGCEKELVQAINSKLIGSGSTKRVYLDIRQDKADDPCRFFIKDRNLLVVDSSNWQVADSHKFSVRSNVVMDYLDFPRPPVKADEPVLVPRPGCIPPAREDRSGSGHAPPVGDRSSTVRIAETGESPSLMHIGRAKIIPSPETGSSTLLMQIERAKITPLVQTLERIETTPIGLSQLLEKLKKHAPQE